MKKGKHLLRALMVMLILAGVCIAFYPLIQGAATEKHVIKANEQFFERTEDTVPALPEATEKPYAKLWEQMQDYNSMLHNSAQSGLVTRDAYETSPFFLTSYGLENEVFGVISIPAMEVQLPLYLGASTENMANGAAVLGQTSIPIGRENTNSVIAGHRGWNGYPYFLDIEKLKVGDKVYITNLWETLTYEVSAIQVVEPNDIDAILIREGRDMITLLTCHPPNTGGRYRYLVFCERVLP